MKCSICDSCVSEQYSWGAFHEPSHQNRGVSPKFIAGLDDGQIDKTEVCCMRIKHTLVGASFIPETRRCE